MSDAGWPGGGESGYDRRAQDGVDPRVTSTFSLLPRLLVAALAIGVAAGLAACGRKSDPELPTVSKPAADRPVGIPVGPIADAPKPPKPERKSFLLDPLL